MTLILFVQHSFISNYWRNVEILIELNNEYQRIKPNQIENTSSSSQLHQKASENIDKEKKRKLLPI